MKRKRWPPLLPFVLALMFSGCGVETVSPSVPQTTPAPPTPTPTATPLPLEEDPYRFVTEDGEVWIVDNAAGERVAKVPYSQEKLERTGDGNSDGGEIAAGSYYLDAQTFAFVGGDLMQFFGCVSHDGGQNWIEFRCPSGIDRLRVCCVDFWSAEEGVIAVGGDRQMNSETKTLFFTSDGGTSWVEQQMEEPPSNRLLNGVTFADRMHGILSLDVPNEEPEYWYTEDGGATFAQLELPLPEFEGAYYFKADSLRIDPEDESWTLTLGQGNYGQRKAVLMKTTSESGWTYAGWGEKPASGLG